jgi:hypothetical protein
MDAPTVDRPDALGVSVSGAVLREERGPEDVVHVGEGGRIRPLALPTAPPEHGPAPDTI